MLAAILAAPLAGCGGSSQPELTPGEKSLQAVLNKGERIKGKTGQKTIEEAVAKFKQATGHVPASLDELVQKGILKELPEAPHGRKFAYHPETGTVELVRDGSTKRSDP